jgi:hypothetical protein
MLEDPEFEPEFYEYQIALMKERYLIIFKSWGINWKLYYEYVSEKLRHKQYWIWVYLCGFEKFIQGDGSIVQGRKTRIYKDADSRIRRIIGDSFKIEDYINSL